MKKLLLIPLFSFTLVTASKADDTRLFELRTYHTNPGKLEALHARFRDHTVKLFEKYGMTNLGYWVPDDNEAGTLTYVLAYPDRQARDRAWKGFFGDPAWKAAYQASIADGKLVKKVDRVFLSATDFSPAIKVSGGKSARSFQLRTYTTPDGKLDGLKARFRDHTVALFAKHGITNFAYWTPAKGEQGAANTLIYFIAGKDAGAIKQGFDGFRKDPAWQKARKASEVDGRLTTKVVGVYMTPTDYSPTR